MPTLGSCGLVHHVMPYTCIIVTWQCRFGLEWVVSLVCVIQLSRYIKRISAFVIWYIGCKLLSVCGHCCIVDLFGENNLYSAPGMTSISKPVSEWCQTELSKLLQTEVEKEMVE